MSKTFVQFGAVMPVVAASSVDSGSVMIVGSLLGVALGAAASGEVVSVSIEGVHRLPKVPAADIAQGQTLVYDSFAGAFDDNADTPAAGDLSGACAVAFASAGPGQTEVLVRLTGVPGTLAA